MPVPHDHYKLKETYAGGYVEIWATSDQKNFAIVYGLQMQEQLSRVQAASALGSALLHFAQCEGKLD